VTRAPHLRHQDAGGNIYFELANWSRKTQLGKPFQTPGVIFTPTDAVIPDGVWISRERLASGVDEAGHLTVAPELMVEVLSPGQLNEQRDRVFAPRRAGILDRQLATENPGSLSSPGRATAPGRHAPGGRYAHVAAVTRIQRCHCPDFSVVSLKGKTFPAPGTTGSTATGMSGRPTADPDRSFSPFPPASAFQANR